MKKCKRCALPEGKFDVIVGKDNTCNYCNYFDSNINAFLDYQKHQTFFEERIEKTKGVFEYDALVGISGGKDSSYVLHKLVTKYHLNVLAFTYENGFLNDSARKNITKLTNQLGVDHYYHFPDWKIHSKFYHAATHKMGDPCLACAFAGYFLTIKLCFERKIPFFIHGRSPSQMFRNFYEGSKDLFITFNKLNIQSHSYGKIAETHTAVHEKMRAWIYELFDDPKDADAVLDEFFVDTSALNSDFAPEFLSYFLFEPYDEEAMKQELEGTYDFKRADNDALLSHGDCDIHDVCGYMYEKIQGVSMLAPEIGFMLRNGEIDATEAERIYNSNVCTNEVLNDSINTLCDALNMTKGEFDAMLEAKLKHKPEKFDSR
jgi:hypothetical protein